MSCTASSVPFSAPGAPVPSAVLAAAAVSGSTIGGLQEVTAIRSKQEPSPWAGLELPSQGAWDPLALGDQRVLQQTSDHHLKNGQTFMLSSFEYAEWNRAKDAEQAQLAAMNEKRAQERELRMAERAAQRQKREESMLKTRSFTWKKETGSNFAWTQVLHALVTKPIKTNDIGYVSEGLIGNMAMRMYSDHRVMGAVVLPGVSHIGLMAATTTLAFSEGRVGDFHIKIGDVLFERPFMVMSAPSADDPVNNKELDENSEERRLGTVCCRANSVAKTLGAIPANAGPTLS